MSHLGPLVSVPLLSQVLIFQEKAMIWRGKYNLRRNKEIIFYILVEWKQKDDGFCHAEEHTRSACSSQVTDGTPHSQKGKTYKYTPLIK